MEKTETIQEYNERWRRYVLRNQQLFPSLFDDEVKKNNYKLFGREYRY